MSAQQDSRYQVIAIPDMYPGSPYVVSDRNGGASVHVDLFRTNTAAHYAARLLNSGQAHIDPHAVLGCKVVQS